MTLWQWTPYSILPMTAAAISAAIALAVWRGRPEPGAVPCAVLMLGVCAWSLGDGLAWASTDPQSQLLWMRIEYLGVVTVPGAWLFFVLQFTRRERWLRQVNLGMLSIEPLTVLLLVWTNDAHHLFWSRIEPGLIASHAMLRMTHGVAFWLHTAYSYALLLVGAVLLIEALIRSAHLYRGQVAALLIAVAVPWLGNVIYVAGLSPLPGLDLTPFALTVSGLAIGYALLRFRLFDLVPVAREAIVESMSDGVFVLDARGRVVDVNMAAQRILGRSAAQTIGQAAGEVFGARPDLVERFRDVVETRVEIAAGEGEEKRHYDLNISPVRDRYDRPAGRLIVLRDITRGKQAEEELRKHKEHLEELVEERTTQLVEANRQLAEEVMSRMQAQERTSASLKEKEVLLQEIHHRVKNNLQIVCSLLSLQSQAVEDRAALAAFEESQHRVRSMALIHEKLYRSQDLAQIDFGEYLRQLVEDLARSFRPGAGRVKMQVEAEDIRMDIDAAVPCGLIVTQLLSNALKHAFPDGRPGKVVIGLHRTGDSRATLFVDDDGVGLPCHLDLQNAQSLGLQLVGTLVDQVGGTIELDGQEGTRFRITFPVPSPLRPQSAPPG